MSRARKLQPYLCPDHSFHTVCFEMQTKQSRAEQSRARRLDNTALRKQIRMTDKSVRDRHTRTSNHLPAIIFVQFLNIIPHIITFQSDVKSAGGLSKRSMVATARQRLPSLYKYTQSDIREKQGAGLILLATSTSPRRESVASTCG